MLITSISNQKFKDLVKLHESKYRKKTKLFLVEGEHLIQEALKHDRLETLIIKANTNHSYEFSNVIQLEESLFEKLSLTVSSNTFIGVCKIETIESNNPKRILALEHIQDPGNMGTLIRSACAFGFDQIICTADCVDIYNEKVIRSTQGALFQIPLMTKPIESILELKKKGFRVYATGFQDSVQLAKVNETYPLVLLLGNEGQGLSDTALRGSDAIISIEMHDFDSLNVSVAGSILMYRFRKP